MSVRLAAIWAVASQYLAFAINFAASIVLARYYIAPEQLGQFTIAFAAVTLFAVLQDFGLNRYVAGEQDLTDEKIRAAYSVSLAVSGGIALLALLLAWPMARFYDDPALLPLMLVIGAGYMMVPLAVLPIAMLQRKLDFRSSFIIDVSAAAANAAISITLAAQGWGALALAFGVIGQQGVRALMAQWRAGWLNPFPLSFKGAGPIVRFGGGSTLLTVSGTLGVKAPDLIIGRLLDNAALGLYARAAGLAVQFRQLVSGAVAGVFYPAFARIRDSGQPLDRPYLSLIAGYSAIVWPAMAGLAVAAEPLVRIVYGDRWVGAAPLLSWLAVAEMVFIALPMHVEMPILLGKMRLALRLNLLDTAASILLLLLAATVSIEAAALSRVAYALVWMMIYAPNQQRLLGYRWADLLIIYAKSGVAAAAAVLPLLASYRWYIAPAEMGFAMLLAHSAAGVMLWALALLAVKHPVLVHLKRSAGNPAPSA